jgi:hypothetical protein
VNIVFFYLNMREYSGIYKLVVIKHSVINVIYMVNLCKPFFHCSPLVLWRD